MMAGLFLIFSLAIAAIFWKKRELALGLLVAGLVLCVLMFWHHVTDVLKINW